DEITRGEYRPETWLRCRDLVRAFEGAYAPLRGGSFFDLVVWLAQRDEEAVAARQEMERAAKTAKKEAERGKSKADRGAGRAPENEDGKRAARAEGGLPRGRRKRADALDADRVEVAGRDQDERERGGVDQRDEARPANREHEQLSLFGGSDAG